MRHYYYNALLIDNDKFFLMRFNLSMAKRSTHIILQNTALAIKTLINHTLLLPNYEESL